MNLQQTHVKFDDWKRRHLSRIVPANVTNSIDYDVKVQPLRYLKGMLYMNAHLEDELKTKLFKPLPLRTDIIPKHIILTTTAIIDQFYCPPRDVNGDTTKKSELIRQMLYGKVLLIHNTAYSETNTIHTIIEYRPMALAVVCCLYEQIW